MDAEEGQKLLVVHQAFQDAGNAKQEARRDITELAKRRIAEGL